MTNVEALEKALMVLRIFTNQSDPEWRKVGSTLARLQSKLAQEEK